MRSILCIGVLLLVIGSTVAHAEPALVVSEDDLLVGLLDGNGDFWYGPMDWHAVGTHSKVGVINVTLRGVVPNDTGRAVSWDADNNPLGSAVGIYVTVDGIDYYTTDWKAVISASGQTIYWVKATNEDALGVP